MAFRILPGDLYTVVALACAIAVAVAAGWFLRRRIEPVFSARGWNLFFKIHAIIALVALLVLTESALEPTEMFIYGRF